LLWGLFEFALTSVFRLQATQAEYPHASRVDLGRRGNEQERERTDRSTPFVEYPMFHSAKPELTFLVRISGNKRNE